MQADILWIQRNIPGSPHKVVLPRHTYLTESATCVVPRMLEFPHLAHLHA